MTRRTRSFLIDNNTGAILINTSATSSTDPIRVLEPSNFFELIDDRSPKLGGDLDAQQKNISNANVISSVFFVGDGSQLTGISGTGASVANIFQQGKLMVFTGTARWYAPFNLEFQSITARVVESANDDIVIRIKKNNNLFVELEIPEDQFSVVITDNNNVILTMNEGDYLTVDILQVGTVVRPGCDLYIQFKYINT